MILIEFYNLDEQNTGIHFFIPPFFENWLWFPNWNHWHQSNIILEFLQHRLQNLHYPLFQASLQRKCEEMMGAVRLYTTSLRTPLRPYYRKKKKKPEP